MEGFFSTDRSAMVGVPLSHSGVTGDLSPGAVPVLAAGRSSGETASAGPLPSMESATCIPSN